MPKGGRFVAAEPNQARTGPIHQVRAWLASGDCPFPAPQLRRVLADMGLGVTVWVRGVRFASQKL